MRTSILAIAVATAALLTPVSLLAQDAPASESTGSEVTQANGNPFASRGAALSAVMRYLQGEGVPLVYLGNEGGVSAYLGESANGANQVLYEMPDGEHVVAGLLFRSGGEQLTRHQITEMMRRFHQAAAQTPDTDLSALNTLPEPFTVESTPETEMPIIDWFREQGLTVTILDDRDGGVTPFLVETAPASETGAGGKMQIFYQLPDERYAVAGLMLRRGGVNVTGLQIGRLQQRFLAEARTEQQPGSTIAPGANPPRPPEVRFPEQESGGQNFVAPERQDDDSETTRDAISVLEEIQAMQPVMPPPVLESSSSPAPETAGDEGEEESSVTPGSSTTEVPAPVVEEMELSTAPFEAAAPFIRDDLESGSLLADFNQTVFFTVGAANLPAIYMIADPQCPFCHEFWRQIRPYVLNQKLQLRIVMIAGLAGSDTVARAILAKENPSAAWLAGQGSVGGVDVGPAPDIGSDAWEQTGNYLARNHAFISRYGINQTPTLMYVSREDDQVYVSRGIPEDMNAYLAAL